MKILKISLLGLAFFMAIATGIFADSTVTVSISNPNSNYASITTNINNNTGQPISSIQLSINENYVLTSNPGQISWSGLNNYVIANGQCVLNFTFSPSLESGSAPVTLSGGIDANNSTLSVSDITTGYNNPPVVTPPQPISSAYTLGGWVQTWTDAVPSDYSLCIYGMCTDLVNMKSGLNNTGTYCAWTSSIGNNPDKATIMFTACGENAQPVSGWPAQANITSFLSNLNTSNTKWKGVDFDDECSMDQTNLPTLINNLHTSGYQTNYTFLGGSQFVDSNIPTQDYLSKLDSMGCDRFILMMYGDAMWDNATIGQYLDAAVQKVYRGGAIPYNKIYVGVTSKGFTIGSGSNLELFINEITKYKLGGLMVWPGSGYLTTDQLNYIAANMK